MEKQFEILPGQGIGEIKFGSSFQQVKKILGEPDEMEESEEPEKLKYYHYDELALSLSFDGYEDWRLTTIVGAHESLKLYGYDIFGLSPDELYKVLKNKGSKNISRQKDESQNSETIESEDFEMMFWFEKGELMEVQWGPLFSDEDAIAWP